MDLNNLNQRELEALQVQKEEEYTLSMQSLTAVEIRDIELSRKVAELQLERKTLATALVQGKFNLRKVSSELRVIKTLIYKRLRGE